MLLVYCYILILSKLPNLEVIDHTFLLKGHTHLEADGVHSVIEKKRSKLKEFEISSPHDW